jgi:hypothetical protein
MINEARSELRRGETLQAMFPAVSQHADDDRVGHPMFMLPGRVTDRLMLRRRLRMLTKESIFPLAPRMIVGLTTRRLMIWSARPGWRVGSFIGYVSRDRVLQAAAPGNEAGWRAVSFYLAQEPTVSIKVPARAADDLTRELSGRPELSGR